SRNRDRERRPHRQRPSSTSNSTLRVPKRLAVREVHLAAPDGGRFQSFQSLSVICSTAKWESLLEFEAVEKCGRDLECADKSAHSKLLAAGFGSDLVEHILAPQGLRNSFCLVLG